MEGSELVRLELQELNTYVRHHLQLYVTWYTFFLTVNFAAMGWFTSVLLTGALKQSLPIIFLAAFFDVQIVLSYIASVLILRYFQQVYDRVNELLAALEKEVTPLAAPKPAIPIAIYNKVIGLMCNTLITFGVFWVVLLCLSVYLVPLRHG